MQQITVDTCKDSMLPSSILGNRLSHKTFFNEQAFGHKKNAS